MKCQFIKRGNEKCQANSVIGSNFCFFHNPEMKDDKDRAVKKGGLAFKQRKQAKLKRPISVKTVKDILLLLEEVINDLRTEDALTHQRANSIAYISSVMLKAIETNQFEERITALENRIINQKN